MTPHIEQLQRPFVVDIPSEQRTERTSLIARGTGVAERTFGTFARVLPDFYCLFRAFRTIRGFPRDCTTCICSFLPKEKLALDTDRPTLSAQENEVRRQMIAKPAQIDVTEFFTRFNVIQIREKLLQDSETATHLKSRDIRDALYRDLNEIKKKDYSNEEKAVFRIRALEQSAREDLENAERGEFRGFETRKRLDLNSTQCDLLCSRIQEFKKRITDCIGNESSDDEIAVEMLDFCRLLIDATDGENFNIPETKVVEGSVQERMQKALQAAGEVVSIEVKYKKKGAVDTVEINTEVQKLIAAGFSALAVHFSDPTKPPSQLTATALETHYAALSAFANTYGNQDHLIELFRRMHAIGENVFSVLPVDAQRLNIIDANTGKIMRTVAKKMQRYPALSDNVDAKALVGRCQKLQRESSLRQACIVLGFVAALLFIVGMLVSACADCIPNAAHSSGNHTAEPSGNHTGEVSLLPPADYGRPSAHGTGDTCTPSKVGYRVVSSITGILAAGAVVCYKKANSYLSYLRARF